MEDAPVGLRRVEDALRSDATSFDFFQAVRLLEDVRPGLSAVGGFGDPADEVVRFVVPPALGFPPSEVRSLELPEEGRATMRVNFMGLTGPLGVLPHNYTLLLMERERARDRAPGEFLDLFHHRIVSLHYRAWRKHRFAAAGAGEADRLREHLLDLAGLGPEVFRDGLPLPDNALIWYLGLTAAQPRGAAALQQLVADYFGVAVEVEQFVGGWFRLPDAELCRLDEDPLPTNRLGSGAVVGDEVWDTQSRVRLRLGPLARAEFERFLPGGSAHEALRALARFFAHDQPELELQLVLARDEVAGCVLQPEPDSPQPLGWATWIRSSTFDRDADDTVLTL